jgi:CheY-like chemotaxis protein
VVTARALQALATLRTAQGARPRQALGLVAAPGGQVGIVLDVPGTADLVFAHGTTAILFVAAELGTRLDGRVLDRGGPAGHERFVWAARRRHILGTADDPALRDLLTIVLEEEGDRVPFASTPAVAEVASLAPDLILLDGRGPGDDTGWALRERLKTAPATAAIPVLVPTGRGREATAHAARLADLDPGLVPTPCERDEVLGPVRRRLAGDPRPGSAPSFRA